MASSYIVHLNANNLDGWAMSQPLPICTFQWVNNMDELQIMSHSIDSAKGYILELDLEYPEELHGSHNIYPLAPERLVVQKEWMSDYQKGLRNDAIEVEKLVPNLMNKSKYVVHYRNLQLYLSLGMKLTKVHRVLEFKQNTWMEPYIRMNTELCKKATSDFEKVLYKLMSNRVFGKTMENV